jgi:hypothetical protein
MAGSNLYRERVPDFDHFARRAAAHGRRDLNRQ